MKDIRRKDIKIDIYLKVTNQDQKDVFDIIYEHIKVTKRNPQGYTWWGNNQPFSPKKLDEFYDAGQKPQALLVIPHTSGGNDNVKYIADILGAVKFKTPGLPNDNWRPKYYIDIPHKVWLKLSNFREIKEYIQDIDVKDYYLLSNDEPLASKLKSQYACGYVYRFINTLDGTDDSNEFVKEDLGEYRDTQAKRWFLEGEKKLKMHISIERNQQLIRTAKSEFKKKHGKLFCEACGFNFQEKYGKLGEDFIEGHHKKPISLLYGRKENRIEDIAMLCSNCHSMIHMKRECLTIEELNESRDGPLTHFYFRVIRRKSNIFMELIQIKAYN